MGYYKCLWSWGWDFCSIWCCYYFAWNHCEHNFRSHKQLLVLRSPCGSEHRFHNSVTQAAKKLGAESWGRRETEGMDAMWPKKTISGTRQRPVTFVSWAISPGVRKSSQFQTHTVFRSFGLNRLCRALWKSPARVHVYSRCGFSWQLLMSIIILLSPQVISLWKSLLPPTIARAHSCSDAEDTNTATTTRIAADSRSRLKSSFGDVSLVFSLSGREWLCSLNSNYILLLS